MDDKADYENLPDAVKRQVQAVEARQQEAAAKANPQSNPKEEGDNGRKGQQGSRQQAEALLNEPDADGDQDDSDLDESEKGRQSLVDWQAEFQKESARNAELQRQLMMLQSMQASQQQAPQEAAKAAAVPDWDNLAEQYPEDLVGTIRQMYEHMQAMQAGQQQVQQQAANVGQQQFLQQLAAAVPDWQKKNADPGWIKWLGEADPVSGVTRQQALDTAAQRQDAAWVARIFNSYFGGNPSAQSKPKRSAGLADLAEPSSSRTTVAGESPKTMTVEDVRKLNQEISRNPGMRADPKIMELVTKIGGAIPVTMQ